MVALLMEVIMDPPGEHLLQMVSALPLAMLETRKPALFSISVSRIKAATLYIHSIVQRAYTSIFLLMSVTGQPWYQSVRSKARIIIAL